MKISLIICAYNEEKYIEACLEHALKNSHGKFFEIIVVDNNSTDKTKEIAEKFAGVKIISETQKGANHARARGADEAQGEILAFVDADTRIPPGWIEILEKEFSEENNLVFLSGPYTYYDFPWWKNFLAKIYWNVFAYATYLVTGHMGNFGNLAIKSDALRKIGGVDTSIFFGDDTNIARRAHEVGKVKFSVRFVASSSARRFQGEGILKTVGTYAVNFFSQTLLKKSITQKEPEDIR